MSTVPGDISDRAAIEKLVRSFYARVIPDPLIGPYFTQVMHFSWEAHIPVMIDFWENLLLGGQSYKGNPMIKHIGLHRVLPLEPAHFERWLALWEETIHNGFEGPKAEEAIQRAGSIATIMQNKLRNTL